MKKRIIIFGLLIVLLMTTLLAGCNGNGNTTGVTTGTSPSSATTITSSTEDLTTILNKAIKNSTVYYEMTTSVTGQEAMKVQYWIKGKKYRIEVPTNGVISFIDMGTLTMYMYTKTTNTAIKMSFDQNQIPANPNSVLEYNPKIVGTELLDGKVCTVIAYSYERAEVKMWIWNDFGYPVKMETKFNGATNIIVYKNFSFDPIEDSMFELPKDADIIDSSY